MSDWLDRVAANLLLIEAEVRTILRAIAHGQPHPRVLHGQVNMQPHELRAMIRGIIPSAITSTPRRAQHARLAAALHQLGAHLLTLNQDTAIALNHALDPAAAAALDLINEATEWVRQVRWAQATRAAKVKGWSCPPLSITTLSRLLTPEQAQNAPSAVAGLQHHPAAALHLLRRMADRDQLQLSLPPPPSAEVVDIRQLQLQLTPAVA